MNPSLTGIKFLPFTQARKQRSVNRRMLTGLKDKMHEQLANLFL